MEPATGRRTRHRRARAFEAGRASAGAPAPPIRRYIFAGMNTASWSAAEYGVNDASDCLCLEFAAGSNDSRDVTTLITTDCESRDGGVRWFNTA
ncbi:hypothetical protein EVAR_22770_1 [Eumeta japonica]|uniref:Uncharacterized protein n=1 Tax=Eumeta variegata TaxID=151549 RepID=A0A4C1UTN7_EUMVA|nr:hypothetical protein EVAR_22770_1 [Eumeta japonica]